MKPKRLITIAYNACADFLGRDYLAAHDPICSYMDIEGGLTRFLVDVPDEGVWASAFLDDTGHVVLVEGARPSDVSADNDRKDAERVKLERILDVGFRVCLDEIGCDFAGRDMSVFSFGETGSCIFCQVDIWPAAPDPGPETVCMRFGDPAPVRRRVFLDKASGALVFIDGSGEVLEI